MADRYQGQNTRPNQEEEELPSPPTAVLSPPDQVVAAQLVVGHNHNRDVAPHNTAAAAPDRPEDCNYCIPPRLLV